MTKFSDLKLDPKVLKAITDAGYETPTPIQSGAIPPALEGRDVLGIAQTGTGKTASFTLPMITLLGRGRARARMPRSLVLCPTRELAAQVAENFDVYAKYTRLTKALLIGGVSFGEQDKLIDRGVDVLIATPGRLLDHFERGKLLLTGVQIMVVDEADRMLDMGFIPDIERIFQLTPFTRQTLFFSATMAPEIERITDTFLHSPERIEVARQATTSETITQKLIEITPTRRDQAAKQKRELLRAIIRSEGEGLKNAIIFCNRKTDVDVVAKSLKAHGFDAAPIHGDLDQRHRTATLDEFREGKLRLLVASDVAARGLDIPAVSHVINFDLPSHAEDYVHRIGRTGRAGRQGTAISLGTPADEKYLTAIESLVKQSLPRAPLPEGFALTAAAQDAPRPPREGGGRETGSREGGRRERGRDRDRRGRRDDSEQRSAGVEEPKIEVIAVEVREERREDRQERRNAPDRPESRPENRPERSRDRGAQRGSERRDDRGEARTENRGENRGENRHEQRGENRDDNRGEARGDNRNENRRHDRGDRHAVMGMGEHMPEFMTRTFRPGIIEGAESDSDSDAREAAPMAAQSSENAQPQAAIENAAPETPASDKPARKRRSRSRGKSEPVSADPTAATEVSAETSAEAAAEGAADIAPDAAAPAEAMPEPAVTSAPVTEAFTPEAPAADGASDAAAVAEAPPAAEKPKRKPAARKPAKPRAPRKPKAAAAEATAGESADASAAQPQAAEATSGPSES